MHPVRCKMVFLWCRQTSWAAPRLPDRRTLLPRGCGSIHSGLRADLRDSLLETQRVGGQGSATRLRLHYSPGPTGRLAGLGDPLKVSGQHVLRSRALWGACGLNRGLAVRGGYMDSRGRPTATVSSAFRSLILRQGGQRGLPGAFIFSS